MKAVEFSRCHGDQGLGFVHVSWFDEIGSGVERHIKAVQDWGAPLWVRYDNGQLCKFKRREAKESHNV